jgi:hypothetical protein
MSPLKRTHPHAMKRIHLIAGFGAAILATATLVFAAVEGSPRATLMAPGDYDRAMKEIERDTRTALVACQRLSDYQRSVCNVDLTADTKIRTADLRARYLGTAEAQNNANIVRVEAQFEVERTRCEAFSDEGRDRCLMIAVESRAALINELTASA